ncbi:MAG: hypothetical protein JWP80_182 [Pseudomonas sp.]|nr:hypothetical protein [Pseudomonas sp.]
MDATQRCVYDMAWRAEIIGAWERCDTELFLQEIADIVGAAEGCDRPGTGRFLEIAEGRADLIAAFGSSYRDLGQH